MTDDARNCLRDNLANAINAYTRHEQYATSLLASINGPCCDDGDDCECPAQGQVALRAEAAVEAQLAQAAAGMAQAMATLLAANQL